MRGTVVIRGYRQYMRALQRADQETRRDSRTILKGAGEHVRRGAARRLAPIDAGSARGFVVIVRQKGIAVRQGRRKTTGRRPDYGALQMRRALLPAFYEGARHTVQAVEHALERICRRFG